MTVRNASCHSKQCVAEQVRRRDCLTTLSTKSQKTVDETKRERETSSEVKTNYISDEYVAFVEMVRFGMP